MSGGENFFPAQISPRDQRIMDAWDNGQSIQMIAQRLSIRVARVSAVVFAYAEGNDARTLAQDAKRGSAQLLAAIHRLQGVAA